METNQQKETLDYFRKHADKWEECGKISSHDQVNVIEQRNEYVLHAIEKREKTENTLDVGCGTGDLVHEISKKGIRAYGIDFAEEMMKNAIDTAKKNNLDLAEFKCISIFDYDFNHVKYDVISANGFIEYISFDQLKNFLDISFLGLKKGGSLILGSRNRLFNIFSLNDFTENEIINGDPNSLLFESMALVKAQNCIELIGIEPAPLHGDNTNKKQLNTGIDVSMRFQYTPVQLMNLLTDKGFEVIHISPIHIHGVVPKFKDKYPAIHGTISNQLQTYAEENMSLIPFASSFMIHAKRG